MNRRDLLKVGVSILPVASRLGVGAVATGNLVAAESSAEITPQAAAEASAENSTLPWQRRIRRIGQLNMTEHDPAVMNVEACAGCWAGIKSDVYFLRVTGIR